MTEDRLRQLIRDYLCVTDQSLMSDAIEQMLRAHSARVPVVFSGYPGHSMTEILSVARQIRLSFAVEELGTDPGKGRTITGQTLPIYIPRDSERLDDLEKLLTLCFQKHVAGLANMQGVSVHSIEYLFLPWLVLALARQPDAELDQIVRNAILKSKNGTVGIDSMAGPSDDIVNALHNSLAEIPFAACSYVGCEVYDDVTSLPQSFPDHRLNESLKLFHRDKACREMYGGPVPDGWPSIPDWPVVKTVLSAHPDNIGVIARNFLFFSDPDNYPVDEKVRTCLNRRLYGQSEKQISAELGHVEFSSFQEWLTEHHLDIVSRENPSAFERWVLAKNELFDGTLAVEGINGGPTQQESPTSAASGNGIPSDRESLAATDGNDATTIRGTATFPTPQGTKWEEVTIEFVSDDTICVKARDVLRRFHFAAIGFQDGRKGDKSDSRWKTLLRLAERESISFASDPKASPNDETKKAIQELRKRLRLLFGIDDDPFKKYTTQVGYAPRFHLVDRRFGKGG